MLEQLKHRMYLEVTERCCFELMSDAIRYLSLYTTAKLNVDWLLSSRPREPQIRHSCDRMKPTGIKTNDSGNTANILRELDIFSSYHISPYHQIYHQITIQIRWSTVMSMLSSFINQWRHRPFPISSIKLCVWALPTPTISSNLTSHQPITSRH